ncbi:DNA-binding protein [Alkalihalobacillus sp. MEB130]|uniref:DNA-binding protein n=1 Tax=Alkalihalobacillus sp. MEB130 TaxID=2976704 RepID=UPI0028DE272D|nr:DNA-binding protein [Alkalihalobacillus sp. MEB130]MDT8858864.1 DNA-binding protein [Alkalihalobacillus sp. MEB130]
MEFIWLAIGIAAAGYFISDGLKNFQNPSAKNLLETLDDSDEHELIIENDVHHFIGVTKEDAKKLIEEHPSIPHLVLNNKVYYPKAKLREWLMKIGG